MRLLPAILLLAVGCSSKNEQTNNPPVEVPDTAVEDTGVAETAPPSAWKAGPYGTKPRDVAGPSVIPTTNGDWSFEERFTGEDHYFFLVYDGSAYTKALFKTTALTKLLRDSVKNAHYFFLFANGEAEFNTFAESAKAVIPEEWAERVHFVTTNIKEVSGWVGDVYRDRDVPKLPYEQYDAYQWAVDRTQHVREVGMLGRLGGSIGGITPDLSFIAQEGIYYEFEFEREKKLAEDKATVIELIKDKSIVDTEFFDVDLPALSGFDTMEVDLTMNCDHHRDGECGAWDYISDLKLCEGETEAGTPKCNDEIARWITSYWRETRWVTDISGMLAMLGDGGKKKMRWWASKQWDPRPANYIVSLSLRLSNRGKGMRPVEAKKVFVGGNLNAAYNDRNPPATITIPSGTKKTELYALITGHGAETAQCAEFCNHTHHFKMNGGKEFTLDFPMAQSADGCRKRVNEGVVPNQHGTWYYGRGGWCPGLDVRPFLADMTTDAKVGMENTLTYQALIGTTPPAPMTNYGNTDFTAYVVFWK